MTEKNKNESCYVQSKEKLSCCKIESVISVDERGQMVLPKEMRQRAGIKPGDKMAVIAMEREGKICCLSLIKVEDFAEVVKGYLAPMMKDIISR